VYSSASKLDFAYAGKHHTFIPLKRDKKRCSGNPFQPDDFDNMT
jgi:hypothetical protein